MKGREWGPKPHLDVVTDRFESGFKIGLVGRAKLPPLGHEGLRRLVTEEVANSGDEGDGRVFHDMLPFGLGGRRTIRLPILVITPS